ncbi:MAG TPA: head GIN domain-containing protein [Candidatus Acidoferrales bacterium]|jgi:hypothetical protein|nr:head GIN domain-containing protein [Candidatus Acidoferrales bacterium]
MKKTTILLVAAVALLTGCFRPGVRGDGVIKTEDRPISDFSKIEVTGGYEIKWTGGKPALSITTDQNLLPLIATVVSGDTLQIGSTNDLSPTKGITIILSSASLAEVRLTGGNSFKGTQITGPDLKLESTGASEIHVDGSVTNLDVTLTGASQLNAKSLSTQTATIELTGASDADVTVTDTLKVSITGAGSLTYSGNPKTVHQNIAGAGSIQKRP